MSLLLPVLLILVLFWWLDRATESEIIFEIPCASLITLCYKHHVSIESLYIAFTLRSILPGFIHGDFNDHNILVQLTNPDTKTYVADGILDFEDIQYGAYAWDLGLMLAHVSTISKTTLDPLEATGFALAGYRSVRSLSEEELSILKV